MSTNQLQVRFKDYPNNSVLAELYNPATNNAFQIGFYHGHTQHMTLHKSLCHTKPHTYCSNRLFFMWRVLWLFEDVIASEYIHIYRDKLFNNETLTRNVQATLDNLANDFADFGL